VRDYVHVTDLARAHVLALQYRENAYENRAVNLGTGKGYSVTQIISAVEAITSPRVRVEVAHRRAGDPPEL
jgi:UDP-arabinose 4-epimerase